MSKKLKVILSAACIVCILIYLLCNGFSQKAVELKDNDGQVNIALSDNLRYSYPIWESVGENFKIEYDKDAFKLSESVRYDNPVFVIFGMSGGDKGMKTCTLRPLKLGEFTIRVLHDFRGDIQRVVTYKVTVE